MRRAAFLILAAVGLLLASVFPASAAGARVRSDYGYVFMQRDDGACIDEQLWTGLRQVSAASADSGFRWSSPTDAAWAWYQSSNWCTSQTTTLYGEGVLQPSEFQLTRLGDLSFVVQLEMFDVTPGEGPPFLVSGPSNMSTISRGFISLDLTFTQEGRVNPFNSVNGVLVPPAPHALGGAPITAVTAWQYTGGSVEGSVTGDIEFDLASIVFAEIGSLTILTR